MHQLINGSVVTSLNGKFTWISRWICFCPTFSTRCAIQHICISKSTHGFFSKNTILCAIFRNICMSNNKKILLFCISIYCFLKSPFCQCCESGEKKKQAYNRVYGTKLLSHIAYCSHHPRRNEVMLYLDLINI